MGDICRIDSGDLDATLKALGPERNHKIVFDSLVAGAEALQSETIRVLKLEMGESATRIGLRGRPQYADHDPMTDGVMIMKNPYYNEAGVHIMGDFRLKWFEKGTSERYVGGRRKEDGSYPGDKSISNYRGEIEPNGFFSHARSQGDLIVSAIEDKIDSKLKKMIK